MTYAYFCVYNNKTCPKHVQFYPKNELEKLVHLVGFIIRIYYDAQSSECRIQESIWTEVEARIFYEKMTVFAHRQGFVSQKTRIFINIL